MQWDPTYQPRLRPVEALPLPEGNGDSIGLRDRSGLSDAVLTLSKPALHIVSMMDGKTTCEEVRRAFQTWSGQSLPTETLQSILTHLEDAHFLEGPQFDAFYSKQQDEYRSCALRDMPHASALGIVDDSGDLFEEMLAGAQPIESDGVIRGLVAPHLDYPRGRPCYAAAYGALRGREAPGRVVILGTNHFGRATSVVATASDFSTPLGTTRTDLEFLERLEDRCGDLRACEFDHAKEHSIELQVAWLQFLFGATTFKMVAVLCPDPCGPTGTAPCDGNGVDLADFASALGSLIDENGADTLLVAGADLSHVGAAFDDPHDLDEPYRDEVRRHDLDALDYLTRHDPSGMVRHLAERDNRTNVCSAGCIFALATALQDTTGVLLDYHQAVDQETQTCVTCAAVAFS